MLRQFIKVTALSIIILAGTSFFIPSAQAEDASASQIKAKLDQVLKNQKEITAKLDKEAEELRVIRIRVSKN